MPTRLVKLRSGKRPTPSVGSGGVYTTPGFPSAGMPPTSKRVGAKTRAAKTPPNPYAPPSKRSPAKTQAQKRPPTGKLRFRTAGMTSKTSGRTR